MNNTTKRALSLLLVFVLCISLLPAITISASAASDSYIYNWGTRGVVATSLSENAIDFYEENNATYDILSSYTGGTGKSDAPSSALYSALKKLMTDAHSYKTSYEATKELYRYTDCQNGGGKISSFYSGNLIGPGWGEGSWNREHTWPNSKGLGGQDENDIMMLRPTSTSENSSRGNTAYGKSGGYYNPNSESGGKYDLRGDVARIFLYVYVRWGNTSYAWGSSGVMESVEVLLEWMEVDPVDTWELGRNDAVESITGTRNVFVDYPQLAFTLFGEEIPDGLITPAGDSTTKCSHNNYNSGVVIAATCTAKGYTLYTCQTSGCGNTYRANFTDAKGHNYVSGTCTNCGETKPLEPEYVTEFSTGVPYKLGFYSTSKSATYYFIGSMSTTNSWYGASDTAYANGVDVYVEAVSGGYRLYFNNTSGQKQYINITQNDTHYNFTYSSTATSVFTWDSTKYSFKTTVGSEVCYIGNYGTYVNYGTLLESKSQATDYYARLYTLGEQGGTSGGGSSDPQPQPCVHSYYAVVILPTCTAGGYTKYTCNYCGDNYTGDTTAAKGHRYQDGECTACGAAQPTSGTTTVGGTATISFANTSNRTSWDANQQTWENGGVKLVNNKTSESAAIGDNSNPARFYAFSSITISAASNITKIEFECSSAEYASNLKGSIGDAATASSTKVTVTLNGTSDTFTIAKLTKQVRMTSVTVTCAGSGSSTPAECQHTIVTDSAVAPTCTSTGLTEGKYCSKCNEVITAQTVVPALSHNWTAATTEAPKTCSGCGLTEGDKLPGNDPQPQPCEHNYYSVVTLPTCTAEGYTTYTCNSCGNSYVGDKTAAKGHRYQDGECIVCGAAQPSIPQTGSATISFADTSSRTEFSTSKQVWKQNGITVTNEKASDSNDIVDYSNPVRFYQNSKLVISYPGMTKIEINCTGLESKYVESWLNVPSNATATNNDGIITIVFSSPVDSLTYEKLSKQARTFDIKVYAATGGSSAPAECEHTVVVDSAVAPTCTSTGLTEGQYCSKCNEVITAQEVIPALSHDWVEATNEAPKTCDRCGLTEGEKLPGNENQTPDNDDSSDDDTTEDSVKDHSQCRANASGWAKFWNAFSNFFRTLFGGARKCVCGQKVG